MKAKLQFFIFLLFISTVTKAQGSPVITLTATTDATEQLTFEFNVAEPETTLQIDWGDGNPITTPTILVTDEWEHTQIKGTPLGEGKIKIYGNKITYFDGSYIKDGPKVSEIDLTKATDLLKLFISTNNLTALDLSKNTLLTRVDCLNNQLTELDLTNNPLVTSLDCTGNQIETLKITECTALSTLKCGSNQLKAIDLSKNKELKNLYCLTNSLTTLDLSQNTKLGYISVNQNQLTSLDVTGCTELATLFCTGNQLTELKASAVKTTLNCSTNKLSIATLPAVNPKNYLYTPQEALEIGETIKVGEELDLSAQTNVKGILTEPQATTFTWKTESGISLVQGNDYTEVNGKFTFTKAQTEKVYCEMTTPAFPKFTGDNALKTTLSNINILEPAITLTATTDATEQLTFEFNVAEPETTLQIDWGDGNLITTPTILVTDEWEHTQIKGTPLGEGKIKIYGNKITYFDGSYIKDGPKVSEIDLTKATDLLKLFISTNNLTTLDLSKNTLLTRVDCLNNQLTELDLTNNPLVTSLDCTGNQIETLKITECAALSTLKCGSNQLKAVDLSKNKELKNLYCLTNSLTTLDLSQNTKLGYISVNQNQLTSLDVTGCTELATLFCTGNQLTELKASAVKTTLNCSTNKLSIATLPAVNPKNYLYTPQEALEIGETIKVGEELDLSAQTNVKGILTEPQATTFTWKTESGTSLVQGNDYTEVNGKFTFTKVQAEKVYCEMSTPAFPKFTGDNVLKSTGINITQTTGVSTSEQESIKFCTSPGELQIVNLKGEEKIAVLTLQGIKVKEIVNNGSIASFSLTPNNYYIIVIDNTAYKVSIR